jgi:hypothetical protein
MIRSISSDDPSRGPARRPYRWRSLVQGHTAAAAGVFASVAVASALLVSAPTASAAALTNGPTVSIGQYSVPTWASSAPSTLPTSVGATGGLTPLYVTESAAGSNQVVTIPNPVTLYGGSLEQQPVVTADSPASFFAGLGIQQTWSIQNVGYVGVSTPTTAQFTTSGAALEQQLPVYRIIGGLEPQDAWATECLQSTKNAAPGTAVQIGTCSYDSSDLWIIGNTAQRVNFIASTGFSLGGLMPAFPEWISTALQPNGGPSNSVIENLASLASDGWNTNTSPVLSADTANIEGYHSALALQSQTTWPTDQANSTWIIPTQSLSDASNTTSTGSGTGTGGGSSSCVGITCLVTGAGL